MNLPNFIALQTSVEQIKEKIETAPDKGYEIGIAIGAFLPLVVLVALAYWMYKSSKNRKDL
jgi:hypothetical protein